jgi:hypothetical protein
MHPRLNTWCCGGAPRYIIMGCSAVYKQRSLVFRTVLRPVFENDGGIFGAQEALEIQ